MCIYVYIHIFSLKDTHTLTLTQSYAHTFTHACIHTHLHQNIYHKYSIYDLKSNYAYYVRHVATLYFYKCVDANHHTVLILERQFHVAHLSP